MKIFPIVFSLIAAILFISNILIYPIGISDRIPTVENLYSIHEVEFENQFIKDYGIYQYYIDNKSNINSYNLIVKFAIYLDKLFTDDFIFDIRFLGAIQIAICVIFIYMTVFYISHMSSKSITCLISSILIFVFTDSNFTVYFNSFYTISLDIISFLTVFISLIMIAQKIGNMYFISSIALFNTFIYSFLNYTNILTGIILFLTVGFTIFNSNRNLFTKIVLSISILISVFAVFIFVLSPRNLLHKYNCITVGVLISADNPEKALHSLKIDTQYSILTGSDGRDMYKTVNVEDDILKYNFYPCYNFISICKYYIYNPNQLSRMFDIAIKSVYDVDSNSRSIYGKLKNRYMPNTVSFIFISSLILIALNFKDINRMVIIFFMISISILKIFISIVNAGTTNLTDDTFLYTAVFDFVVILSIANREKI